MKKYSCKNCGAILYWNAEKSKLVCEYCGSEYNASELDEENINEIKSEDNKQQYETLDDKNTKATDESESNDLVVYSCSNCGAEVITSRSTIATTCAFCGESLSLTNKFVEGFKPDSVIPFKITEKEAKEIYKKYCKKGILTPRKFFEESKIKKMKGIYVPFWLHTFTEDADATIEGGITTSKRVGDDRIDTTKLYNIDINATATFEKIPTDGLKNIDNDLVDAIEPFDYSALSEFSPAYMAGYYAEEFNETAEETVIRAINRANKEMEKCCLKSVKGFTRVQTKQFDSTCENMVSSYSMLPIWVLNVKYKDQFYTYIINGQTGKISGVLPKSSKKLWTKIGITAAVVQIVCFVVRLISLL